MSFRHNDIILLRKTRSAKYILAYFSTWWFAAMNDSLKKQNL